MFSIRMSNIGKNNLLQGQPRHTVLAQSVNLPRSEVSEFYGSQMVRQL